MDYKNRALRDAAYEKMAIEMNIAGFRAQEVSQKIKNIRSMYYQELKKIEASKLGNGPIYKPTVLWFRFLDGFLRNFVHMRHTLPPYERNQSNQTKQENQSNEHSPNLNTFLQLELHTVKDEPTSPIPEEYVDVHDSLISEEECEINVKKFEPNIQQTEPVQPTSSTTSTGSEWDEYEAFARYIAASLKQLPAENAIAAECEIIKILSSERLQVLKKRKIL